MKSLFPSLYIIVSSPLRGLMYQSLLNTSFNSVLTSLNLYSPPSLVKVFLFKYFNTLAFCIGVKFSPNPSISLYLLNFSVSKSEANFLNFSLSAAYDSLSDVDFLYSSCFCNIDDQSSISYKFLLSLLPSI